MNSQSTQSYSEADEAAVRALPERMIDAWNRGSGDDFAAPFSEGAHFVAFEGTHLEGRRQIALFHERIFNTVVKGTRLEGEVKFVHFPIPQVAVMHAVGSTSLPGRTALSPSRDSMQLFLAMRRDGAWRLEAVLNARKLTMERQFLWDDFESLPAEAQRQVIGLIAALKQKSQ